MIEARRTVLRSLFVLGVALLSFACRPASAPAAPSLADRSPDEEIPSDLDLIARIEVGQLRTTVPRPIREAFSLIFGDALASNKPLLSAIATRTTRIHLGLRPNLKPSHWDYVLVLEGDFEGVDKAFLDSSFHAPRDLGDGLRSYDARKVKSRTDLARIYTYRDEQWILASAAEIDALERVIEGHVFERSIRPPSKGLVSFAVSVARLTRRLADVSPRAAELLSGADNLRASFDLREAGLSVNWRLRLKSADSADLAASALSLLIHLQIGDGIDLSVESVGRDLVGHGTVSMDFLIEWLELRKSGETVASSWLMR